MEVADAISSATIKVKSQISPKTNILTDGEAPDQGDPIIATFFDLPENPDPFVVDKVKEIKRFLVDEGVDSEEGLLSRLKELRKNLGSSDGSSVNKVYQYLKLMRQAASLTTQARAMEVE